MDSTNRELALILLRRLADFETQRIVMANLLDFARNPETNQPLVWRPMADPNHDEILRDNVRAKYVEIERTMLNSTDDCPNALSLLTKVSEGLIQEPK